MAKAKNNKNFLLEKWEKVLNHSNAPRITDNYRRAVTAQLLENQLQDMKVTAQQGVGTVSLLSENSPFPTNVSAVDGTYGSRKGGRGVDGFDPVLINLVRRAVPQMIAFDVCGVQPMTQPTGLIFAMKSRYVDGRGSAARSLGREALYNEADPSYTGGSSKYGVGSTAASDWTVGVGGPDSEGFPELNQAVFGPTAMADGAEGFFGGRLTSIDERNNDWAEMGFSIEKTSVVAKSRSLKAEYSMELAQDLKAVHGLDAESELSSILATEILAEINREVIRDIYLTAKWGCRNGTAQKGIYDLDIDSDGRWSAEKFKGLMYRIEREANAIAQDTRRGRGNFLICSSDVAAALQMAGMLDYAPAIQNAMNVDEAQNTFVGVLNGKYKVFVDPFTSNQTDDQYFVVGYKGTSAYDAGMFYCPYVPLQMVRASDQDTFQPKIGFKTRYGIAFNPMVALNDDGTVRNDINAMMNQNYYYRKVLVKNL